MMKRSPGGADAINAGDLLRYCLQESYPISITGRVQELPKLLVAASESTVLQRACIVKLARPSQKFL